MGRLYTPKETARLLNVPVRTLERWRWERSNLPYVKVGRAVRYRVSDLDAWLDANMVGTEKMTAVRTHATRTSKPTGSSPPTA